MKYEIVNASTGEIDSFETNVDIALLEDYNGWVIENKLNPPTYSPQEYAKHLETKNNAIAIEEALEYLEFYNKGTPLPKDMLDHLVKVLKNEK